MKTKIDNTKAVLKLVIGIHLSIAGLSTIYILGSGIGIGVVFTGLTISTDRNPFIHRNFISIFNLN